MSDPAASATVYHCEFAWLGGDGAVPDVQLEVVNGRIAGMTSYTPSAPSSIRLPGLTMPGLVNTHSHVFHRAIRGHTQAGAADFWQWRELMYRVAARLDPESLYRLAFATYVEMALAGVTAVGEFFYVHHQPGGVPYADPNALGRSVIRAAVDAGIRITLLDTLYLQGGVRGEPLTGAQLRFTDGTWQRWAERVDALREGVGGTFDGASEPGGGDSRVRIGAAEPGGGGGLVRIGAAIHSVRGVPRDALGPVAEFARTRTMPLHVHLSEQPAENAACVDVFGLTPTELLAAEGVLSPSLTAVHATHLTDRDIELLGAQRVSISMCPTTERDLADGVGPAIRLAAAGAPLCVGSDGHMMIDLWDEGRAIELNERLVTGRRGHLAAADIARAITTDGAAAIGWPGGGLTVGAPADFATVSLDSVRTAGARSGEVLAHALFSATASDVTDVVVAGRRIVSGGAHVATEAPGHELDAAIAAVLTDSRTLPTSPG